jgi:ParB family chromosome partitioning protein
MTVRAEKFFTREQDGLEQDWQGRVFLNPPYSQPEITQFVAKLLKEVESRKLPQAILLTNDNTDTHWFRAAAVMSAALCFVSERIKFCKPDGQYSSPTNGQAFFYFGEEPKGFIREFSQHGLIMKVVKCR